MPVVYLAGLYSLAALIPGNRGDDPAAARHRPLRLEHPVGRWCR